MPGGREAAPEGGYDMTEIAKGFRDIAASEEGWWTAKRREAPEGGYDMAEIARGLLAAASGEVQEVQEIRDPVQEWRERLEAQSSEEGSSDGGPFKEAIKILRDGGQGVIIGKAPPETPKSPQVESSAYRQDLLDCSYHPLSTGAHPLMSTLDEVANLNKKIAAANKSISAQRAERKVHLANLERSVSALVAQGYKIDTSSLETIRRDLTKIHKQESKKVDESIQKSRALLESYNSGDYQGMRRILGIAADGGTEDEEGKSETGESGEAADDADATAAQEHQRDEDVEVVEHRFSDYEDDDDDADTEAVTPVREAFASLDDDDDADDAGNAGKARKYKRESSPARTTKKSQPSFDGILDDDTPNVPSKSPEVEAPKSFKKPMSFDFDDDDDEPTQSKKSASKSKPVTFDMDDDDDTPAQVNVNKRSTTAILDFDDDDDDPSSGFENILNNFGDKFTPGKNK